MTRKRFTHELVTQVLHYATDANGNVSEPMIAVVRFRDFDRPNETVDVSVQLKAGFPPDHFGSLASTAAVKDFLSSNPDAEVLGPTGTRIEDEG